MLRNKVLYSAILIVTVLAFVAGCATASIPAASASTAGGGPGVVQPVPVVNQPAPSTGRGITVVGTGKASGTPDVANINVGVETQADSVQQAVADNKTRMTTLLDTLKVLGIAERDIQTTNYGVYTQREPQPASNIKDGLGPMTYHVNNQVSVTIRDVSKLGDVLDKVVAAGANNIYGVNFSVDDTTKLQADARAKAFADAQARAESLARLAGVALGDVVSVSEVIGSGQVYDGARMSAAAGLGGGGAPIQPGELEVNISIQVTFAIK
jgi:uncharacterized protein YggE